MPNSFQQLRKIWLTKTLSPVVSRSQAHHSTGRGPPGSPPGGSLLIFPALPTGCLEFWEPYFCLLAVLIARIVPCGCQDSCFRSQDSSWALPPSLESGFSWSPYFCEPQCLGLALDSSTVEFVTSEGACRPVFQDLTCLALFHVQRGPDWPLEGACQVVSGYRGFHNLRLRHRHSAPAVPVVPCTSRSFAYVLVCRAKNGSLPLLGWVVPRTAPFSGRHSWDTGGCPCYGKPGDHQCASCLPALNLCSQPHHSMVSSRS